MKTKALILSFLALATEGFAASVSTTALPSASSVSWTITPAFVSQYMFRGVKVGGPAFQPSLDLEVGNLALGMWGSFSLARSSDDQSDPELDLYAFYTVPIAAATSIVAGCTLYTYPRAEKDAGFYRWTFEPSLALNYTTAGVRFTPRLYFDTVLDGPAADLTAAYALPLAALGSELDLSVSVGTYLWRNTVENSPEKVRNYGDFWLAQVEVPFQVTAKSKVTLGFVYTRGSNNFIKEGSQPKTVNPAAVGRGVITLKYAFAF
jgi:uncharacterized protein (TIGR02001 family)